MNDWNYFVCEAGQGKCIMSCLIQWKWGVEGGYGDRRPVCMYFGKKDLGMVFPHSDYLLKLKALSLRFMLINGCHMHLHDLDNGVLVKRRLRYGLPSLARWQAPWGSDDIHTQYTHRDCRYIVKNTICVSNCLKLWLACSLFWWIQLQEILRKFTWHWQRWLQTFI